MVSDHQQIKVWEPGERRFGFRQRCHGSDGIEVARVVAHDGGEGDCGVGHGH
jgi:hypothetical protein